MFKKAFTLAEVLITLMIIGIVAALTIPSVISNYQQQEFKTGLKKAVSVLNEAIQMNIQEDGETPYENSNLYAYLKRHMNIIKTNTFFNCYNSRGEVVDLRSPNGSDKDCMSPNEDDAPGHDYSGNEAFYTADGMRFELRGAFGSGGIKPNTHFYLHESGLDAADYKHLGEAIEPYPGAGFLVYEKSAQNGYCGSYGLASNPNNTVNTPCVLMVDVNGDKKPNPPMNFKEDIVETINDNGTIYTVTTKVNQNFGYSYPSPTDKKLQDIFSIMITDEKAIPFGVVAQRAMYSK